MKVMEREVCLDMAMLEENEPVLTTKMKQHGGTRTHPQHVQGSTRPEQLRTETRVFEALRVTDYGGVMPDNNVAETARSPPDEACLSAPT